MKLCQYLLGKGLKPQRSRFKWNSHHPQPKNRQESSIRDTHDISIGNAKKGPLAFTMALPEPLEGFDLNMIELTNSQFVSAGNVNPQLPCAKIVPDRMGLHPVLIEKMSEKFGIKQLTPIQARMLQCFYARYDICSCAPTGSGKTLAICIALVARLMRDGPPKQGSTVFLVPTEELGYQIERWMRSLWWYSEEEDPLFLSHCTSERDVAIAYAIGTESEDVIRVGSENYILPNLSGNIRYPPRNPYILLSTPETFWGWLKDWVPLRESSVNKRLFPQLDTVIIDEVESVLKVDANMLEVDCVGRKILQQLYVCKPYDTPIQVLFNSATLGPTTVNHLRRFMKKNIFDAATVRMFPDTDVKGEYLHSTTDALHRGDPRASAGDRYQNSLTFTPSDRWNDEDSSRQMQVRKMRYSVPSSVRVLFHLLYTVPTGPREMALCAMLKIIKRLLVDRFHCSKALVVTDTDEDETFMIRSLQNPDEFGDRKSTTRALQSASSPSTEERAISPVKDNGAIQGSSGESQTIIVSSARRIRGIDIPELQIAFIASTPKNVMDFVHLAGRVGRLGFPGSCIFFIQPSDCRVMRDYCSLLNIDFDIHNKEDFDTDMVS
ncbi:ATP-dependent DEAD/H RNA helicase [Perkinsela sp. CCAP 1560/4]|nr:ATP-dependent DEAD/H RNA helicase [Perkinsela sp. CCAP 1560/4]|eukprot:KNH08234.1 ATP-dependent DEAD/H RNA helicase [Perkinsela sp. CCAP 1560/4]